MFAGNYLLCLLGVAVVMLAIGLLIGPRRAAPNSRLLLQEQMLDAAGEAIIGLDPEGKVAFWNRAAERLYDWSAGEAIGKSIADLTSSHATREEKRVLLDGFLAGAAHTSGRYVMQKRNGTDVTVLATATPVVDRRGRPAGYVGVVRDVSQELAAEAELRASEERLRLAMRATHDAVWDWPVGHKTITWGEGIDALFGAEADPSFDWWMARIHPRDREEVMAALNHALADHQTSQLVYEYRFERADGQWAVASSRGYILRDEQGRPVRMIGSIVDVTEQKKMQQQLHQAERLTSLGRLAAGMAHEFNNVLMAIQPFADLLKRRRDEASIDRAVEQIGKAVLRGRRVTEEIMRFTRPPKPVLKKMDLAPWLGALRNELQAMVAPVAVVIDAPPGGLGVEADAALLHQGMVNLVVNARDAMEGHGLVTVTARDTGREEAARHGVTGTADSWVHVSVLDQGPGIAETDLPHIFEPLFTTKRSGTGLGLAVTHAAIRQHGGAIDAESRPGEGTTLHIFLPRVEIEPAELAPRAVSGLPRRILMIEDDEAVAAGLVALLSGEGCEVALAMTGADGLRQVASFAPDVVILDVDLPDANGRELYDRIRQISPSLPIVLTSGHVLGGSDGDENIVFLQKPYELDALIEAVSAARG